MDVLNNLLDESPIDESPTFSATTTDCPHDDRVYESETGRVTCLICSELLDEHYLVNFSTTSNEHPRAGGSSRPIQHVSQSGGTEKFATRARPQSRAVISDNVVLSTIPSYIPVNTKKLALRIFNAVTDNKIFRNSFKKAILLACVHRAAVLTNVSFFIDDILNAFGINKHDANRGISYVSNNLIDRADDFEIPYCSDDIYISSILITVGLRDAIGAVTKLFTIVREKSTLLNTSHYKSVVFSCVYYFIHVNDVDISLDTLVERCGIAKTTLLKKFAVVDTTIVRHVAADVFYQALKRGGGGGEGGENRLRSISSSLPVVVTLGEGRLIGVNKCHNDKPLPIDRVTNVYEWNFLTDGVEYVDDATGQSVCRLEYRYVPRTINDSVKRIKRIALVDVSSDTESDLLIGAIKRI